MNKNKDEYDIYNNKIDYVYKVGRALERLAEKVDELDTNVNINNMALKDYDKVKQTCDEINNLMEPLEADVNSTISICKNFKDNTSDIITRLHDNLNVIDYINTNVTVTIYTSIDDGETFEEFERKLYIQEYTVVYVDALEYFFDAENKKIILKYKSVIDKDYKEHEDGNSNDYIIITPGTTKIYLILEHD